jgi:hypothetical protein
MENDGDLNAHKIKNGVFWVVTPCGSCKNRRFGRTWRLLHQGDKNRCTKDLLEIGVNVVDWIGLAQDRYRWRALVNSVMNLRVP